MSSTLTFCDLHFGLPRPTECMTCAFLHDQNMTLRAANAFPSQQISNDMLSQVAFLPPASGPFGGMDFFAQGFSARPPPVEELPNVGPTSAPQSQPPRLQSLALDFQRFPKGDDDYYPEAMALSPRVSAPLKGNDSDTSDWTGLDLDSDLRFQRFPNEEDDDYYPEALALSPRVSASLKGDDSNPHKCERIHPLTGKPCNTTFTRPSHLTRHDDTIHNTSKQKLRCHLCTKEKTFSRNDSRLRHFREFHPDHPELHKTRHREDRN